MVIGGQEISTLVLGVSAMNAFKDIPPELINMRTFWEHSVAVGVFARLLGAAARPGRGRTAVRGRHPPRHRPAGAVQEDAPRGGRGHLLRPVQRHSPVCRRRGSHGLFPPAGGRPVAAGLEISRRPGVLRGLPSQAGRLQGQSGTGYPARGRRHGRGPGGWRRRLRPSCPFSTRRPGTGLASRPSA